MSTEYSGVVEPPPGVQPNFIDPPSQLRGNIALHTVFLTLATASVVMRLCTRILVSKTKLGIDDYLCMVSYALTVSFSGLMFKSYSRGIGRHMWDVPAEWLVDAVKFVAISSYVYLLVTATTKLTFLFFYRRVFSPQCACKYAIDGGIVFIICATISLFFASVFACVPVARTWDETVDGHCFNPDGIDYLSGAVNAVVDLYIFVLPIPLLWKLEMGTKRKLKLLIVFSLGLFACVASFLRLGMTTVLRSSLDMTWNVSFLSIWATIEVNVGIICSCLILLPAFMDRYVPESIRSSSTRLLSYTRSLSFIRSRHRTESLESDQDSWPGYGLEAASGSQRFVKPKATQSILKTESFKLDYVQSHTQPQTSLTDAFVTQIPVSQQTRISASPEKSTPVTIS
ncbi:hypothetical protein F4776DRAFT_675001 [Hypoxylon sp. NC0597]|nr:hypothetical protein F4776DRAFT_675001 [Hypoxylon sp. NC0597]